MSENLGSKSDSAITLGAWSWISTLVFLDLSFLTCMLMLLIITIYFMVVNTMKAEVSYKDLGIFN